MRDDTIVALATAEGVAGLSVVRLSGPAALAIARRLVGDRALAEPVASHRARLAVVRWPLAAAPAGPYADAVAPGQALDEAVVLPLVAPHSFTGEDTVEFSCHGGRMPARLVVAACQAAGARLADPGEFSRRAFLNGKLSLEEAESVADLVHAEHAAGARAALAQLRGALSAEVAGVAEPLRALLVEIEGSLEFGDEDDPGPPPSRILAEATRAAAAALALAAQARAGRRLRDGVQVVLAGAPNAGKSSLFNALLGEERAIVDAEPGTTRDVVTARVVHRGLLYVLHDTAGLRDDAGRVERLGMHRTEQALATADVVLLLHPADDDGPLAAPLPPGTALVAVTTKCDLRPDRAARPDEVATSSATGRGLEGLWLRIESEADAGGLHSAAARGVLLNERHRARLVASREPLTALCAALASGPGVTLDIAADHLRRALLELDEISGRVFSERLLGDVFARFCVGK